MTAVQKLTPSVYKRMRSQWDAMKTDDKLQQFFKENPEAYNAETKKLAFDGVLYQYNPKKHPSRKLQLSVFKHYYANVETHMTKYGKSSGVTGKST